MAKVFVVLPSPSYSLPVLRSISLALQEDGVPHGVDAQRKSDDGSSDSDETLIENIPEPVGLPRYGGPPARFPTAHGIFVRTTEIVVPPKIQVHSQKRCSLAVGRPSL